MVGFEPTYPSYSFMSENRSAEIHPDILWPLPGLNQRPSDYESGALTN